MKHASYISKSYYWNRVKGVQAPFGNINLFLQLLLGNLGSYIFESTAMIDPLNLEHRTASLERERAKKKDSSSGLSTLCQKPKAERNEL